LEEHFDFSREGGGEIYAAGFSEVAKDGYIGFSCDYDRCDSPLYNGHCEGGYVEDFGLADNSEANEGTADEDFVSERVHDSAELACDAEFSCDSAVNHIRNACYDEKDKSDVKKVGEGARALVVEFGCVEKHNQEDYGQDEPAHSQDVRNVFQHRGNFTFERQRIQY